jgi:hypothetical protein
MKRTGWIVILLVCLLMGACSKKSEESSASKETPPVVEVETLKEYPITGTDGVITQTDVVFDSTITSDGNGSLKITATAPTTVLLYETGDLDVENARLTYSARLRTENVTGKVFLEMWCSFDGRGEFFSRALQAPLSGTVDWTSQETPFFLKAGENPNNVKLNLVIDGTGTAWIDQVKVVKGPLGDT